MIKIEWKDNLYQVGIKLEGLKELNPTFQLTEGTKLIAERWFPTKPPRPMSYKEGDNGGIVIGVDFVKELKKKEEFLTKKEVFLKEKDKRIKTKLVLSFDDFLAFCGKKAFDAYISDVLIGFGKVGQVMDGELTDIKYEIAHAKDQKIVLDIDASTSKLRM